MKQVNEGSKIGEWIERNRIWIALVLVALIVGGGVTLMRIQQSSGRAPEELQKLAEENVRLRQELATLQSQPQPQPQPQPQQSVAGTQEQKTDKININTADATTLDQLPGIGPAKASTIIQYRTEHGPFKTTEEIMDVPGIGQKTFEQFSSKITVE